MLMLYIMSNQPIRFVPIFLQLSRTINSVRVISQQKKMMPVLGLIGGVLSSVFAGADLEGGGGRTPLPQGFDPLPTQRVPPLILF